VEGSTSTVHMAPWWPLYVPSRSPLAENQAQIIWSFATLKMISPSWENLTCVKARVYAGITISLTWVARISNSLTWPDNSIGLMVCVV
jgi:hypothetical protein